MTQDQEKEPLAYDVYERQIILMHQEMKALTMDCKVEEKRYQSVILDLAEFEKEEIRELYEWLKKIYDNEFKHLRYVWTLLTPDQWKNYETYDIQGTREQKMLKEARKAIRTIWETKIYRTQKQLNRIARKKGVNRHKM